MKSLNPLIFFKCLADDTRLKCLLLLAHHGELCVCDLTQSLKLSQPKVSRHLAMLRESQLITGEKHGRWVYYQINTQLPTWCQQVLQQALQNNKTFIPACSISEAQDCQ